MKSVLVSVALIIASVAPTFAIDPACKNGTAPEGWKRAGGYCEISARLNQGLKTGDGSGVSH